MSERRRFPRYPMIIEIQYVSDSPPMRGRITDLSEGGLFVDTLNPLEEGSLVTFSFHLADDASDDPVTGEGRVAWNQRTVGMGIEFKTMSDEDWARVKLYLNNCF